MTTNKPPHFCEGLDACHGKKQEWVAICGDCAILKVRQQDGMDYNYHSCLAQPLFPPVIRRSSRSGLRFCVINKRLSETGCWVMLISAFTDNQTLIARNSRQEIHLPKDGASTPSRMVMCKRLNTALDSRPVEISNRVEGDNYCQRESNNAKNDTHKV